MHDFDKSSVRRGLPYTDTIYVQGSVQGVPTNFVLDTGAEKTVISERIFNQIEQCLKPNITKKGKLIHAGGDPLQNTGVCTLNVTLGSLHIKTEVTVAKIKDDALLGMDILNSQSKPPADIILSQNKIVLAGHEIKCTFQSTSTVRKVCAADHYMIQGMSEQIIDVFIQRTEFDDNSQSSDMLIEPSDNFKQNFPLVMAASLVDVNSAPTVKVRILNPFKDTVSINQDTQIGVAQFITEKSITILETESEADKENFMSVRRLKFEKETDSSQIRHTSHTETIPSKSNSSSVPDHLQDLYSESTCDKSESENAKIASLLTEYQDVFSKNDLDLGKTDLYEHMIDTGEAKPVKQPFRRVPLAYADEERKVIDKMLDQGIIRPSNSPWASPLLLTKKKDGSFRPCIDYRNVNKITKSDAFPVPKVDECIDSVAGAKIFSTLDLLSGYHQVPVHSNDIPKTAFCTKYGLFEFLVTPFGMKNSGATFQRTMELALNGLQWYICIIYIDDVIVFAKTFDEHIERLKLIFERLRQANLRLKPKKCELMKRQVTFLGHKVCANGISPDPSNVAKIINWPIPKNATEVKQFLGLCSYYRKYVKNFSSVAKPLNDLTKSDSNLVWTNECQIAFDSLKQSLISPDIMALPNSTDKFILDVDASDFAIGAVLSQIQNDKERVVAYASRSLNKAERNYCVTEREMLAIRYFLEYFRHYLLGQNFHIRSDHQALKYMFSFKSPKGRVARWLEIISEFDFTIEHRKGSKHGNSDSMSRYPNSHICECDKIDNELNLKCGPCKKCVKRAQQMESGFMYQTYLQKMQNTIENIKTLNSKQSKQISNSSKQNSNSSKQSSNSYKKSSNSYKQSSKLNRQSSKFKDSKQCLTVRSVAKTNTRMSQEKSLFSKSAVQLKTMILFLFVSLTNVSIFICQSLNSLTASCCDILQSLQEGVSHLTMSKVTNLIRCVNSEFNEKADTIQHFIPWSNGYCLKDLQDMQKSDPDIEPVFKWKLEGKLPSGNLLSASSAAVRHYVLCWDALVIVNGLLCRKFDRKNGTGSFMQLVTPKCLQKDVLYQMHNGLLAGHMGQRKTKEKLLQKYYWFGVREDVNLWVLKCETCGANKTPTTNPKAPLGNMPSGAVFDRLCTDLLGPFPVTPRKNRYILVVTDHFSKWVEIFAVPDQSAETTARVILNEVIARYGCPVTIHSDKGSNYESKLFTELCKLLEIKKTRTSTRNPKCNGQSERFMKTLTRMIRAYLRNEQTDWDLNLGCLAAAYRATQNESTKLSPNLIMLGREVRLPAEIAFGSSASNDEKVSTYGEYVEHLKHKMQKAHKVCRDNLNCKLKRQKEIYDRKQIFTKYEKGDLVWYLQNQRKESICPKLQMPYSGPFLVIERMNNQNYKIQFSKCGKNQIVHHDKLKLYKGDNPPKWVMKQRETILSN